MYKIVSLSLFSVLIALLCPAITAAQFGQQGRIWPAGKLGGLNRHHRFAGAFISDGYHKRSPGPDVGYYNPYSAHNSQLHSRTAYPGSNASWVMPQNPASYQFNITAGSTPYQFVQPTQPTLPATPEFIAPAPPLDDRQEQASPNDGSQGDLPAPRYRDGAGGHDESRGQDELTDELDSFFTSKSRPGGKPGAPRNGRGPVARTTSVLDRK